MNKERIDTRALFREDLDIRFDVEDYPQISTLVPSNKLFVNFPSISREAELSFFFLFFFFSFTNFFFRIFKAKFYRLNTDIKRYGRKRPQDHCRDAISDSIKQVYRQKILFETVHSSSPANTFFFRDLTRSIEPIISRKICQLVLKLERVEKRFGFEIISDSFIYLFIYFSRKRK